jgi:hypothetical protein
LHGRQSSSFNLRRREKKEEKNKQNFIYRNGCAKEIGKKIKDRKNKK